MSQETGVNLQQSRENKPNRLPEHALLPSTVEPDIKVEEASDSDLRLEPSYRYCDLETLLSEGMDDGSGDALHHTEQDGNFPPQDLLTEPTIETYECGSSQAGGILEEVLKVLGNAKIQTNQMTGYAKDVGEWLAEKARR